MYFFYNDEGCCSYSNYSINFISRLNLCREAYNNKFIEIVEIMVIIYKQLTEVHFTQTI